VTEIDVLKAAKVAASTVPRLTGTRVGSSKKLFEALAALPPALGRNPQSTRRSTTTVGEAGLTDPWFGAPASGCCGVVDGLPGAGSSFSPAVFAWLGARAKASRGCGAGLPGGASSVTGGQPWS